jgi:hypothetical protein
MTNYKYIQHVWLSESPVCSLSSKDRIYNLTIVSELSGLFFTVYYILNLCTTFALEFFLAKTGHKSIPLLARLLCIFSQHTPT